MRKVYIYKIFERFLHWSRALLITILGITGFEIHGTYSLIGFNNAVTIHNSVVWLVVGLIVFDFFWHFTTGEWKQYIPTTKLLKGMARFYLYGIFKNEPHPVKKTELTKLNPLQRLTYIYLKIVVLPLQIITGFVYLYYNDWNKLDFLTNRLDIPALMHTIGAFILVIFLITHIYLTTTGHTPLSNIKSMITGWEDIEE